jgi:hypothetical protein
MIKKKLKIFLRILEEYKKNERSKQFQLKAMLREVFNVNASSVAILTHRIFKLLILNLFPEKIMLDEEHLENLRKLFVGRAIDSMTAKRYAVIMNVNLKSIDIACR